MSGRPLRPELYHRPCQAFQHVRIAHQGQEMVSHPELTAEGRTRLRIVTSGEYYQVSCPYCGDTRQRLWINHRWGLFDPRTQSRNLWLATCYNKECLRYPDSRLALYRHVFSDVGDGASDILLPGESPARDPATVVWPGELFPLHQLPADHVACRYLRSRGFDPVLLAQHLGVSFCPWADPIMGGAKERIIIPIGMDGIARGWTARYIGKPPEKVPKYLHMTGMKKSELLYNFDRARRSPYVVVCEGPSDVWRVGPGSVALLGKSASLTQRTLLATHWGQGAVVMLLDGDAIQEAQEVVEWLRDTVTRRVLVRLPAGKDPGDLTRPQLDSLIQTAAHEQGVDLLALRAQPAPGVGQAFSDEADK